MGVLSQDGIMRFIDITTCKLLFDVGSLEERIANASVSSNGQHIIAVLEGGDLRLYSASALTAELNKVTIINPIN